MRRYLNRINPVIERLVVDLLVERPEDFVTFAVNWFQDKGAKMAKGEEIASASAHTDLKAGISVSDSEFTYNFNPPANYERP